MVISLVAKSLGQQQEVNVAKMLETMAQIFSHNLLKKETSGGGVALKYRGFCRSCSCG
jgi:hypothetical protein